MDIANLLGEIPFAVLGCIGMAYYLNNERRYEREENAKREERLYTIIDNFSDSLNKVNVTMETLSERLKIMEERYNEQK